MNEVHNSHARDDLPLSGGEGAIPEKGDIREGRGEIDCIWDGLHEFRDLD